MSESGYFMLVIGIVVFLLGVLGVVGAGDFQIAGIGVRTVSLVAVVPVGLLMLVAGNKLRRIGRKRQQYYELITQREKQTADAKQLAHDEMQYPQFEGLAAALPDVSLPFTGRQRPAASVQAAKVKQERSLVQRILRSKVDQPDITHHGVPPQLGYPATNYDKRFLE